MRYTWGGNSIVTPPVFHLKCNPIALSWGVKMEVRKFLSRLFRKSPTHIQWQQRDMFPIIPCAGGGNFKHPSEIITALTFATNKLQMCGDITNKEEILKAIEAANLDPKTKQAYLDEVEKLYNPCGNI